MCAQESDDIKSPIESITVPLKQQFDALPPKGKFATGAFVGFAATRVAIKTTTGILKIAGATFVASEVLNRAGVFNTVDLPDISEENMALLKKARRVAASSLNNFRMEVRQRLSPEKVKSVFDSALEKERMGTLGLASGAVAGFVL